MAEYRHYAVPDKQWADVCSLFFLYPFPQLSIVWTQNTHKDPSGKFPNNLPPQTQIDSMSRARLVIQAQPGLDISELDVVARDDHPIRVRVYRKTDSQNLPLFIYIHGGGFVTGGLETDDRYCRKIAAEVDVAVVSVEYRLAPENKFPTGFKDSYDVVKWVRPSRTHVHAYALLKAHY